MKKPSEIDLKRWYGKAKASAEPEPPPATPAPEKRKRFGSTKKTVKAKTKALPRRKVDDPIFVPRRGLLHHAILNPGESGPRLIRRQNIDKPQDDK